MHYSRTNRFSPVDVLVLVLYTAILAWTIPHHEPWADEAQAWLLARSVPQSAVIPHLLRYEGAPPLWDLLLAAMVHLHVSYAGMHWLAGGIAVGGIVVWLRYAPFPAAVRWLMPFTFFLQYQYAVVARSYVLFPLLAFACCVELRRMPARPVVLALYAGLLSLVALHGTLFAAGILCVYLAQVRQESIDGAAIPRRAHLVAGAIVLAVAWAIVLWTCRIPADHAGLGGLVGRPGILTALHLRGAPPQFPTPAWLPASSPAATPSLGEVLAQEARPEFILFASLLTYPIANWNVIALPFLLLAVAVVIHRRQGTALLPWIFILALCLIARAGEYHTGMLWLSLVCALWISWPRNPAEITVQSSVLEFALTPLLFAVLIVQIAWTGATVWHDTRQQYSGEEQLAAFLRPYLNPPPGQTPATVVGLHYHTIGATAFFPGRIYSNQPTQYWAWSMYHDIDFHADEALATHPRFVVIAVISPGREALINQWGGDSTSPEVIDRFNSIPLAEQYGYHETHRFCGDMFIRFGAAEQQCEVVLEPGAEAGSPNKDAVRPR